jgi:hypothetical protein
MGRSPLFKALEVPSTVSAVARSFIDSMIADGAYPKEHFPSGPYPADKLTYKNPRMVEFTTPANKEGSEHYMLVPQARPQALSALSSAGGRDLCRCAATIGTAGLTRRPPAFRYVALPRHRPSGVRREPAFGDGPV